MSAGEWTEAELATLDQMWRSGATAVTIAAAIGKSKNAIVGKAHRRSLAARPSPIRRLAPGEQRAPRKPRRAGAKTLPALPATSDAPPLAHPVALPRVAPVTPTPAPQPAPAPFVRTASAQGCTWPLWGHYERPTHSYCGALRTTNRLWCAKHAAIGVVDATLRRPAAAANFAAHQLENALP